MTDHTAGGAGLSQGSGHAARCPLVRELILGETPSQEFHQGHRIFMIAARLMPFCGSRHSWAYDNLPPLGHLAI
jgi:hypothetical protein